MMMAANGKSDDEEQQPCFYDGPETSVIYEKGRSRWQAALKDAQSFSSLPPSCTDLGAILTAIPALPRKIPQNLTSLWGQGIWENMDKRCTIPTKPGRPLECHLRSRHPLRCLVSASEEFKSWGDGSSNGITLLILAWAYVLTASLAERQDIELTYAATNTSGTTSSRRYFVDLRHSHIDPDELLWWKSLLSQEVRWVVGEGLLMPWAMTTDELDFGIVAGENVCPAADPSSSSRRPPTATEAAKYIARLCQAFNLGTQCSAALAAAVCLPIHRVRPDKPFTIELPRSYLSAPSSSTTDLKKVSAPPPEFDHLDYYMMLSVSSGALSCLYSILWEPGVACNQAGAWVVGIRAILKPLSDRGKLELAAKVISPSRIAPLWLGVLLCGGSRVVSHFVESLDHLHWHPLPIPDFGRWIGTAQSFLDHLQPEERNRGEDTISRAEIWRLRFDCNHRYKDDEDDYSLPPPYGWPPFGSMRASDVDLQLESHLRCSHQWRFSRWNWAHHLGGSQLFKGDEILYPPVPKLADVSDDDDDAACGAPEADADAADAEDEGNVRLRTELSRKVTEEMFSWCRHQVERGFSCLVPRNSGPTIRDNGSPEPSLGEKDYCIKDWITSVEDGDGDDGDEEQW